MHESYVTDPVTLGKAWGAIVITFGAMTCRNDDGGKLAVANVNGCAVIVEITPWRAQPVTQPRRSSLTVSIMPAGGESYPVRDRWDGPDAYCVLSEACRFIGEATGSAITADDALDEYGRNLYGWRS